MRRANIRVNNDIAFSSPAQVEYPNQSPLTRNDIIRLIDSLASDEAISLRGRNLSYADLSGLDLRNADLSATNLKGAIISKTNLEGSNLTGANLAFAEMVQSNFARASMHFSVIEDATMSACTFTATDISTSNLRRARIEECFFTDCNMRGIIATGANFTNCEFDGVELQTAIFRDVRIRNVDLRGCNLRGVDFTRASIDGILLKRTNVEFIQWHDTKIENALLDSSVYEILRRQDELELSFGEIHFDWNRYGLRLRIAESESSAEELSLVLDSLSLLYAKAFLLYHRRFADLLDLHTTKTPKLLRESGLKIASIAMDSPIDLRTTFSIPVGEQLRESIDAMVGARQRRRLLEIQNLKAELDIEARKDQLDRERKVAGELAFLSVESARLDLEKRRLELQKEQVRLERDLIQLQVDRLQHAVQVSQQLVDSIQPDLSAGEREVAVRVFVTELLRIAEVSGLETLDPEGFPEFEDTFGNHDDD